MAAPHPVPTQTRAPRLQSVDALRGAIMMIMAIDHIRDYLNREAMAFSPTDLTQTTAAIFFSRWITHFCAPVFVFTAGIGAFLWMQRGHRSRPELSRFLLTRGLWLIVIEATLMRAIVFLQFAYRGSVVIFIILWAIGASMVALAALIYLPPRLLAALSIAIIVLHNLLDPVDPAKLGHWAPLFQVLHQPALIPLPGVAVVIGYPILPWIAVMAAGFCVGRVFTWEAARRQRFLLRLGLAITIAFVVVRAINVYGDPARWSHQRSALFTVLSFLNCTKYPPSLDFLLMTLGPALVVLSRLERFHFTDTNPLTVFGRVPFFYYVVHFFLAHVSEIVLNFFRYGRAPFLLLLPPSMGTDAALFPPGYGFPLWAVYADWLVILLLLYPVCLWFSRLKQRRHDWWLSYL